MRGNQAGEGRRHVCAELSTPINNSGQGRLMPTFLTLMLTMCTMMDDKTHLMINIHQRSDGGRNEDHSAQSTNPKGNTWDSPFVYPIYPFFHPGGVE